MWLNGGPGSSSLIGLLTENGPYHTSDNSLVNETHNIPNILYNQWTWGRNYSLLYLESPKVRSSPLVTFHVTVRPAWSAPLDLFRVLASAIATLVPARTMIHPKQQMHMPSSSNSSMHIQNMLKMTSILLENHVCGGYMLLTGYFIQ